MQKIHLKTFQGIIYNLKKYWSKYNCIFMQPIDLTVGAGTAHPLTCLFTIGPEPISLSYVQAVRRPTDGRYSKNKSRLYHYYQFQVIMKPAPNNIQEIYLNSLKSIGVDIKNNDIKFIEDNWENPTLSAYGFGWEIWLNGTEITQFTYFQQIGGLECFPVTVEITYGIERIAMFLQGVKNVYDIVWDLGSNTYSKYGDFFYQNEIEYSYYNFEYADIDFLLNCITQYEQESYRLLKLPNPLPIPAYEFLLKIIHNFNILDSRKSISVTERQNYIVRICSLTKDIVKTYYISRKKLGFPMCNRINKC